MSERNFQPLQDNLELSLALGLSSGNLELVGSLRYSANHLLRYWRLEESSRRTGLYRL
jgi:hypothetical protein